MLSHVLTLWIPNPQEEVKKETCFQTAGIYLQFVQYKNKQFLKG